MLAPDDTNIFNLLMLMFLKATDRISNGNMLTASKILMHL